MVLFVDELAANLDLSGHCGIPLIDAAIEQVLRKEQLCIKSWLRQGHEVIVHSYERITLPDGAKSFDATVLCHREKNLP